MKYHFSCLCKHKYKIFICCSHEIHLKGNLAEESFYLYCKKRKVNYYIRTVFLSTNNKCHVTNIYILQEKQKYHITFFCEKNKSIILHHVLPDSPENDFLAAFVMLKLQQQRRNCQTKCTEQFPSEGGEHTFHMAFM